MRKNFFKLSLVLNIALAVLSAIFMFVYDSYMDIIYDGEAFITFLYYVKELFNILALFVGYGTIIYAFSRFDFKNGLISIGTFSVSVFISFIAMVIGSCTNASAVFSVDFLVSMIFYSFGNCFITQMIPAILIAWACWHFTKDNTKKMKGFISWSNPVHKTMIAATLGVFLFNVLYYTLVILLPNLIERSFLVTMDEFTDIIISYTEKVVFYLIMQYLVYFFMYKIYDSFIIKYPDKKEKV